MINNVMILTRADLVDPNDDLHITPCLSSFKISSGDADKAYMIIFVDNNKSISVVKSRHAPCGFIPMEWIIELSNEMTKEMNHA